MDTELSVFIYPKTSFVLHNTSLVELEEAPTFSVLPPTGLSFVSFPHHRHVFETMLAECWLIE